MTSDNNMPLKKKSDSAKFNTNVQLFFYDTIKRY